MRKTNLVTPQRELVRSMMGKKKAVNGIYILRTNNKLYTVDKWDTAWNAEAVGVAIIADECQFVIEPTEKTYKPKWAPDEVMVSGITTTMATDSAKTDFNGLQNTLAWGAQYSFVSVMTSYAAGMVHNAIFKNGKRGYLGAYGELCKVCENKDLVNKCLAKIGGTVIANDYYWSSTQYDSAQAWALTMDHGGSWVGIKDQESFLARAFCEL